MAMSDGEFDQLFMQVAGKSGGIDPLLREFFSFLHRKTDFYVQYSLQEGKVERTMGFPEGAAEAMLISTQAATHARWTSSSPPLPPPDSTTTSCSTTLVAPWSAAAIAGLHAKQIPRKQHRHHRRRHLFHQPGRELSHFSIQEL